MGTLNAAALHGRGHARCETRGGQRPFVGLDFHGRITKPYWLVRKLYREHSHSQKAIQISSTIYLAWNYAGSILTAKRRLYSPLSSHRRDCSTNYRDLGGDLAKSGWRLLKYGTAAEKRVPVN
jgi:hypothetical protein